MTCFALRFAASVSRSIHHTPTMMAVLGPIGPDELQGEGSEGSEANSCFWAAHHYCARTKSRNSKAHVDLVASRVFHRC